MGDEGDRHSRWHQSGNPAEGSQTARADRDLPSVLRGPLSQARDLLDYNEREVSPENLWPEYPAWLVFTDYDGVATRVSGTPELIHDLKAATELETYTPADTTA